MHILSYGMVNRILTSAFYIFHCDAYLMCLLFDLILLTEIYFSVFYNYVRKLYISS